MWGILKIYTVVNFEHRRLGSVQVPKQVHATSCDSDAAQEHLDEFARANPNLPALHAVFQPEATRLSPGEFIRHKGK